MKIFSYFAFTKSKRKEAEEPIDNLTWIKHGFSEFFGTLLLSLSLAGLSTIVAGNNKPVEWFMLHPVLIGFYAGFIAVGFVLFIFLRWSCDLNPSVTITRMIQGRNTYRYGFFKIFIQIIAGILAGLIIYGFGKLGNLSLNGKTVSNNAISATAAASKSFGSKYGWTNSIAIGSSWIFFIELIMTSILLFPIFSGIIKNKYRDFSIMFIIGMAVWMGILSGTAALNPARGFAQQVPGLFFGSEAGNIKSANNIICSTLAMEAGTILAPFFYVLSRGLLKNYINPYVIKIIDYKNFKSSNMKKPFSNKKSK